MKHPGRAMKITTNALLLALGAGALVVGAQASYAAPEREVRTLSTELLTSNEIPPLSPENIEGAAHGTGTVVLEVPHSEDEDVRVTLSFDVCGLSGSEITFVKVDIHKGSGHMRGPIAIDSAVQRDAPLTLPVSAGCVSETLAGVAGPGQDISAVAREMIAEPSGFYFELHTVSNDSGMVRGQLVMR